MEIDDVKGRGETLEGRRERRRDEKQEWEVGQRPTATHNTEHLENAGAEREWHRMALKKTDCVRMGEVWKGRRSLKGVWW
jgi:hypothetical protein